METAGLELIDARSNPLKGGSVTIFAQKSGGARSISENVNQFRSYEQNRKIHKPEIYFDFAKTIQSKKENTLHILTDAVAKGASIVGYGASHSTTTLLHHFEIGHLFDYLVDDNRRKLGLYSPGYGLEVRPSKTLFDEKPDYVVILAWQHTESIIQRNRSLLDQGIQFIVPLPDFRILRAQDH